MKEKTKGFIAGVVSAAVLFGAGVCATADNLQKAANIFYKNIKICIDGNYIEPKDANGNPVEPFIMDGTTYLPVRAIATAIKKNVEWDSSTSTVFFGCRPDKGEYSREMPAPIGTTQHIVIDERTQKYTASVTVKETIRGDEAWAIIGLENTFNDVPKEGYEYVLAYVSVKIESITDDSNVSLSDYDFEVFSEDYTKYDDFTFAVLPSPEFGGEAYEGGTIEGYICRQVKCDDKAPVLAFGCNYYGRGGIWFSLT